MASILFSQGPIERPQTTRQLIIVEALKRRLLTAGFQEVWKKKKKGQWMPTNLADTWCYDNDAVTLFLHNHDVHDH